MSPHKRSRTVIRVILAVLGQCRAAPGRAPGIEDAGETVACRVMMIAFWGDKQHPNHYRHVIFLGGLHNKPGRSK
ncbi:hypothetical protein RRG08_047288 [Elysia crispata]|uniref:Secreted protein n=1 Tax=Elysia crispata TaxID=231223 RepID=A0AAE0ZCP9_9GAST|nr:hypothetical protein RRG08_047288 [Elysia crispata]